MDFTVVSRTEWLAARKALLVQEKEATRLHDALRAARQSLPLVEVDQEYVFEGPDGQVTLPDLFEGRRQLIFQHFMFDPEWEDGCPSCSYAVDTLGPGHLRHLHEKDTSFVIVSRAPLRKLEAWKEKKGWNLPWVSSYGSPFNYDFHATHDETVAPVEHNFRNQAELRERGMDGHPRGEVPGQSVFVRDGGHVFHAYSTFDRGTEMLVSSTQFLDLTPLGRQG